MQEKCNKKAAYHNEQCMRSKAWDIWLNLFCVILIGSQGLVSVILGFNESSSQTLAICSASFSLVSMAVSKIRDSYSFSALAVCHDHAAEMYNDLSLEFYLLDTELNDTELYNKQLLKYTELENRGHLYQVRKCRSILCCLLN